MRGARRRAARAGRRQSRRAGRHAEDRDIEAELAGAQTTLGTAAERHQQTKSTLADLLEQIEGVSTEEVAAQILALQTRLQASLQTTSLLYHQPGQLSVAACSRKSRGSLAATSDRPADNPSCRNSTPWLS